MLILNWKKHYYVPNIFYTDIDFKSTRKGKFFFLSDFVFKLIHKFCFKHILYSYIAFIFGRRWIDSCLNITNVLYKPSTYLKNRSFFFFLYPFLDKKINTNHLKKHSFKIKFLVHFTCFSNLLISIIKTILNKNKNLFFIFLFLFNKIKTIKIVSDKFLSDTINYFYSFFLFDINTKIFKNDNLLLLLYQIKKYKDIISKKLQFFKNKYQLTIVFIKYIKNVLIKSNKNLNISTLKQKYLLLFNKFKLKNINLNLKNNITVHLFLNTFLRTFHNTLYYFFFFNKIIHLKYDNLLNYFNFNNLKLKKELLYIFKEKYILFKNKISSIRFIYRRRFYFFLNKLLTTRQWLIGPIKKIKMFKYMTYMSNRIIYAFTNAQVRNTFYYKKFNNVFFFYNAVKIRENFFYFLGKGRYREEFLLLKNKKWYLKYYLNQFYNISFKYFLSFYTVLKKTFKIKLIKELFLFLEYNISIFIRKHLSYTFYSFNNIYLNMNKVNNNFKHLFFIGDVIDINTTFYYYYEKFLVFFNFIYFIDPIIFKKKHILLSFLYKKIYYFFNNTNSFFIKMNMNKLYNNKQNNSSFIGSFNFFKHYKHYNVFLKTIKELIVFNYKLYIKNIFFLVFKFTLLFKHSNNNVYNESLLIKQPFVLNIKYLLYMYSFDKNIVKYNLINFKNSWKQRHKKMKYWNIRYTPKKILFSLMHYKKSRSLLYNKIINKHFNKKVHNIFNNKKMFFLKKSNLKNNKLTNKKLKSNFIKKKKLTSNKSKKTIKKKQFSKKPNTKYNKSNLNLIYLSNF